MVEKHNVNVNVLVAIGSISTVLLIVTIVGIEAWFHYEHNLEAETKQASSVNWSLEDQRLEQLEKINRYRWRDAQNNVAIIPIDRAIKLVVEERQQTGGQEE